MLRAHFFSVCLLVWVGAATARAQPAGIPWKRHTIDAGSVGADGVRMADINSDGLIDLTTGWEEGGEVRVYLNPGPARVSQPWPLSIVGRTPSVEDAVFADLNGDGRWDIVASCEGSQRSVHAFLATSDNPLDANCWQGAVFRATANQQQWMFALPLQVDGAAGIDLILGSKGTNASVSWLQAPTTGPENETWEAWCERWKLHRLTDAGWIMSLRSRDIDGDGDSDIVFSDRRGAQAGLWWLENVGVADPTNSQPTNSQPHWGPVFQRQAIGGLGQEVMFMDLADLNGDGLEDVVCAVSGGDIIVAYRTQSAGVQWRETVVPMPRMVGTGKAVAVTDVDLDGQMDLVITCENARNVSGIFWMRQSTAGQWQAQDISGAEQGIKFDRIELLDLDLDGDLDVITCEERDNLGVIWYENPTRSSQPK